MNSPRVEVNITILTRSRILEALDVVVLAWHA